MSTAAGEPEATERQARAGRILVVDDDADVAAAMRAILEDDGFTVEVAADGLLAMVDARARPDMVVLDITLPGASGIEVAQRLRQQYGPTLPIVAVTADGGAARKARQVGAAAYLRKPFALHDFIEMIHRVFPQQLG